jgi:hypothetical protein
VDRLPISSTSRAPLDPYAGIEPLSRAQRTRAALIGALLVVGVVACVIFAALLFISAVFHPGSVS